MCEDCGQAVSDFIMTDADTSKLSEILRDSSFGIVTGLHVGKNQGNGVRFLAGSSILLFSTAHRLALGRTHPPIRWVPGTVYPGVKRPWCEADKSPPSSAEVKNGRAVSPLPHKYSRRSASIAKYKDTFTFIFTDFALPEC
jgi:hypothetical protein